MKFLWKTINDIAKYKKRTKTSTSLIDNNGNEITDSHKIGNALNAHFSEIGSKLASKIENIPMCNNFASTSLLLSKTTSFYFKAITLTEILRHIKQLNPAKSTGPEGIPLKFIIMGLK